MRYLLDTHAFIWWQEGSPRLPKGHQAIIENPENDVFISAVTHAEIAIKVSLGKLRLPGDVRAAMVKNDFDELEFASWHAEALAALPWHHRDPFDRMLIAQAQVERLTVLTVDQDFTKYDVELG